MTSLTQHFVPAKGSFRDLSDKCTVHHTQSALPIPLQTVNYALLCISKIIVYTVAELENNRLQIVDLLIQVVEKNMPEEKVGVVVKCDGKYQVSFYTMGGGTCFLYKFGNTKTNMIITDV